VLLCSIIHKRRKKSNLGRKEFLILRWFYLLISTFPPKFIVKFSLIIYLYMLILYNAFVPVVVGTKGFL